MKTTGSSLSNDLWIHGTPLSSEQIGQRFNEATLKVKYNGRSIAEVLEMDIQQAGGIKTMLFGGEGLFLAILRGPGRVWLQSLPFSRFAGRMLMAGRGGKEEGSILGPLGGLLDGDNRY